MSAKAEFVRAVLVRLCPEPERLDAAIQRAESLWNGLKEKGFCQPDGPAEPRPSGWDGLPPAKPAAEVFHPAHRPAHAQEAAPSAAERLRQARADLRHWQTMLALRPDAKDTQTAHQRALEHVRELLAEADHG